MKKVLLALLIAFVTILSFGFSEAALNIAGGVSSAADVYAEEVCTVPLDIMFTIDASDSMGSGPNSNQRAAKDATQFFVDNLSPDDRAGLVSFRKNARLEEPLSTGFTVDIKQNTGTNIEAAFFESQKELAARGRSEAKSVIILLSDGRPQSIGLRPEGAERQEPDPYYPDDQLYMDDDQLYADGYDPTATNLVTVKKARVYSAGRSADAKNAGTVVYSIGYGNIDGSNGEPRELLETVSSGSGHLYHMDNLTEAGLKAIYDEIASIECEPVEEPTVTLTADPIGVDYGGSSTLTWESTNADSCEASGEDDWSGAKDTSGSQLMENLTNDKTYNISCTGPGGEAVAIASVLVGEPSPEAPTVTLTADPAGVDYGGSSTLTWESTNADSCEASGDWSGAKDTSGSESTGSLTSDKQYSISCTGPGGEAAAIASVLVGEAAGSLRISRVSGGQYDLIDGTSVRVASVLPETSDNPANVVSVPQGFHTAQTTELSGHEVTVRTCSFTGIATSCSVANAESYPTSLEGGYHEYTVLVSHDYTTRVVFYYTPLHDLSVKSVGKADVPISSSNGYGGTTDYIETDIIDGTEVNLSAPTTITSGGITYNFTGWSGTGCSNSSSNISVSMTEDRTCTANYQQDDPVAATYNLSVDSSPVSGVGISSSNGYGGTTGYSKTDIAEGTEINLQAPASFTRDGTAYEFSSWIGTGCSSSDTSISFSMTVNMSCTASYEEAADEPVVTTYDLYVNSSGAENVAIDSTTEHGGETNYRKNSLVSGTNINLRAPASVSRGGTIYNFTGWAGSRCSSTDNDISFSLSDTIYCTADYEAGAVSTVDIKANNSDGPITIPSGTSATLTWTSSNTVSCEAEGDWSGAKALNNTSGEATGDLTSYKTYVLTCENSLGDTVSDSVRVNVETDAPTPSVSMSARSNEVNADGSHWYYFNDVDGVIEIRSGADVRLSWNGENVSSCTASSNPYHSSWVSNGSVSGSVTLNPYTLTSEYFILCQNDSGDLVSDSIVVNVRYAELKVRGPDSDVFVDGPITVDEGDQVNFSWNSSAPDYCVTPASDSDEGWGGRQVAPQGEDAIIKDAFSRGYHLHCQPDLTGHPQKNVYPHMTAKDHVKVMVSSAEEEFDYSLSAPPLEIPQGESQMSSVSRTLISGETQPVELFWVGSIAPDGFDVWVSPTNNPCSPSPECSTQVQVSVDPDVEPGTYFIRYRGESADTPYRFVDVPVTVTASEEADDFNYSLSAGSIELFPGESGSAAVTKTLEAGTTQPVTLLLESLPNDDFSVNQPLSNTPCSPGCSVPVTVIVSEDTDPGAYKVGFRAQTEGLDDKFVLLPVQVLNPDNNDEDEDDEEEEEEEEGDTGEVTCTAEGPDGDNTASVNQVVTWKVETPDAGEGYTYEWRNVSGVPSIEGETARQVNVRHTTIGLKEAKVFVFNPDGGATVFGSCIADITVRVAPEFEEI